MCEPTTALLIVSTVAGLVTQQQASDDHNASNQQQAANLLTARGQNANEISLARLQASEQAGQKINANNLAQREAQATTIARAGPAGLSVDALLSDMGFKGASYNESVNANLERTNLALDNQLVNVNNGTASGFSQLKSAAPVDYLGAGLKIAGAADKGGAFDSFKKGK